MSLLEIVGCLLIGAVSYLVIHSGFTMMGSDHPINKKPTWVIDAVILIMSLFIFQFVKLAWEGLFG